MALLGAVSVALGSLGIEPAHADSKAKVEHASSRDSEDVESPKPTKPAKSGRSDKSSKTSKKRKKPANVCRKERPQRFLERPHFMKGGMLLGREHQRALRYRVERYGYVEGLGMEGANGKSAFSHAASVRFFGLPLTVHEKIVPALRCVERQIRKQCKEPDERYTPHAVGGFRQSNTYRGGEVSNHLFGIAVDIDPDRNPCCGCVAPWPEHKLCQHPEKPIYERTSLPRCWIQAFENHGFYWLGHDELEDTMHFEYLGDPDRDSDRDEP
jgi:hypothetical protein